MTRVENEEYLERLWHMTESGENVDSVDELATRVDGEFDIGVLESLREEKLLELGDDNRQVVLTTEGKEYARRLARQHRLAECLIHDVLGRKGGASETEACEFEHIVAPELVDSICILLGHPRRCPHGNPIPRGECCERNLRLVECSPRALTDMRVCERGRVAFVRCERDEQIHRLDCLDIRPGACVKLHQSYPTYVIECEGAHIALDRRMAAQIHVWVET